MNITENDVNKAVAKEKTEWSRSMGDDNMKKTIKVKKAKNNGFIVRLSVEGDLPSKDDPSKKEWQYKEEEYVSTVNPLANDEGEFKDKMNAMEELVSDSIQFNNV